MKDNLSPEEKLLKLIKGHKEEKKQQDSQPAMTSPERKPSARHFPTFNLKKYLAFFSLQRIIIVAFVLSGIYLVIAYIYPWLGLKKISLPKIHPKEVTLEKIELKPEIKPFEDYLKGIENRQIFGSIGLQGTAKPSGAIDVDLTKDINLVGIIAGDNPQAIIEDKKTQKTYYLTKGQFIGEYQVEDIQEGKVIINYQGQRFELYL